MTEEKSKLSYYDVLGVRSNADYTEIKSKYRAAILSLHPDKFSSWSGKSAAVGASSTHSQDVSAVSVLDLSSELTDCKIPTAKLIKELNAGLMFNSVSEGKFETRPREDVLSRFLAVQTAWEVLRDPESRANYDNILSAERLALEINRLGDPAVVVGEEVLLAEMVLSHVESDQNLEFSHPCRCGDFFVISKEELHEAGFVQVELNPESHVKTTQNETQSRKNIGCTQVKSQDGRIGTGAHGNTKDQWTRNSLLLPCQSCSLNLRVQLS